MLRESAFADLNEKWRFGEFLLCTARQRTRQVALLVPQPRGYGMSIALASPGQMADIIRLDAAHRM